LRLDEQLARDLQDKTHKATVKIYHACLFHDQNPLFIAVKEAKRREYTLEEVTPDFKVKLAKVLSNDFDVLYASILEMAVILESNGGEYLGFEIE
jgi:hypothetical protein